MTYDGEERGAGVDGEDDAVRRRDEDNLRINGDAIVSGEAEHQLLHRSNGQDFEISAILNTESV